MPILPITDPRAWFQKLLKICLIPFFFWIYFQTIKIGWEFYTLNHPWTTGDWLINYQGGFVRRGLIGQGLFWVYTYAHFSPGILVFIIQSIGYLMLFLISFLLLFRNGRRDQYLLLVVSPFLFLFQVYSKSGGFRKEILFLSLLACAVWLAKSKILMNSRWILGILMGLCSLLILSHEMLFIFVPYLAICYLYRFGLTSKILPEILAFFSVLTLIFLACLSWPGNPHQVSAICQSWGAFSPLDCQTQGAISWLSRSAKDGISLVFSNLLNTLSLYSICIALALIAYFPVLPKLQILLAEKFSRFLLIFSLLGSIPLFVVAVDWGRFIYIHLMSLFLLSLLIDLPPEIERDSSWTSIMNGIESKVVWRNWVFSCCLILGLVLYSTSWHLPHVYSSLMPVPTYKWIRAITSLFA